MIIIGWREWLSLPDLGVTEIKAKVDTGARTSALHAIDIEYIQVKQEEWVRFQIQPTQHSHLPTVVTQAKLKGFREIKSSNGSIEKRPIISTSLSLGSETWISDMSLTSRDSMGFRMLLGRQSVPTGFLVNPSKSFLMKKNVSDS